MERPARGGGPSDPRTRAMQSVTSRNVLWVVARLTSAYPRLESVFSLVRDFWVHPGLLASRLLAPGGPSRDLRASARWLLFRNGVPCGDSGQEIRPCALMMLGSGGIWRRVAKPWPVSAFEFLKWARDEAGLCPRRGRREVERRRRHRRNKVVARRSRRTRTCSRSSPCALEDGHHGKAVPLIENDEWAFDLASAPVRDADCRDMLDGSA